MAEPAPKERATSVITYAATDKIELANTSLFDCKVSSHKYDKKSGKGSITFKGELSVLGTEAFANCTTLTSIALPQSVHAIDEGCFRGCTSLATITWSEELTAIGDYAFAECSALGEVHIGKKISSIGNSAFAGCSSLRSITLPSNVKSIGNAAFANCQGLTTADLPQGITTIGEQTFSNCESLTTISLVSTINEIGDKAFSNCRSLSAIDIPDGVTKIGAEAFYGCKALSEVVIPDGVTELGYQAFYGCGNLTAITLPDNISKFGYQAFDGCNIKEITVSAITGDIALLNKRFGANAITAFKGKYASPDGHALIKEGVLCHVVPIDIDSYSIPWGITKIGDRAFEGCNKLTRVVLPNSLIEIGLDAFRECNSLKEVIIPSSVTMIESEAFAHCSALSRITLHDTISMIGDSAFESVQDINVYITDLEKYCAGGIISHLPGRKHLYLNNEPLTHLVIPESVTEIGSYTFADCIDLESVTIPSGLTTLGEGAFKGCDSLTALTITGNMEQINLDAFSGCTINEISVQISDLAKYCTANTTHLLPGTKRLYFGGKELTELVIPEGVTEVGSNAFMDCPSLRSVTLPNSLKMVGEGAFKGCDSLTALTITGNMEQINPDAFSGCTINEVSVLIGDLAKYCTANNTHLLPGTKHLYFGGEELTELVIPEGVTEVGSNAFVGCPSLRSVTLPNSLKMVGEGAFKESSIEQVTFSKATTAIEKEAFAHCRSLREIDFCEGLTSIGESAFRGCDIRTVVIPNSVTTLLAGAFAECKNLSTVELGLGITEIGNKAFGGCHSITTLTLGGNALAIIDDSVGCFDNVLNLTLIKGKEPFVATPNNIFSNIDELTIGKGFSTLDSTALAGFPKLNHIIIGDDTKTIAEGTFSKCDNLKRIDLGAGIKSFNTGAIINCHSLENVVLNKNTKEIVIDDSVSYVRPYKYENTYDYYTVDAVSYSLEELSTLPGNIFYFDIFGESLKEVELESIVLGKNTKAADSLPACDKVTIFRGLERFNSYPPESIYVDKLETLFEADWLWEAPCTFVHFYGCLANSNIYYLNGKLAIKKNPQSVVVPKGTKRIGNCTFAECSNLTSINIPEGVKSIGEYAFCYCEKLKSVTLPNSLVTIEDNAFCNTAIQSVTIPKSVTTIEEWAFSNDTPTNLTLGNYYTELGWGCCDGTLYDASHLPMSKVTQANIAGVYMGKSSINGKSVTTPLFLFDNGTYIKTRLDTCYENLYEVGRYKINGTNVLLTCVGHSDTGGEFRRISGGETLSVNLKTGTLGKYGKKIRLWRNNAEYKQVRRTECPGEGEYTNEMFINARSTTSWILDELSYNVKVTLY